MQGIANPRSNLAQSHYSNFFTIKKRVRVTLSMTWFFMSRGGSDDPEELAYYNKIRKEIDDMKKDSVKKGIPLNWDTPERMDK